MITATLAVAALLAARAPVPFEAEIDSALAETAAIYPVPKALVIAVISVESGFRWRAVSHAGAKGLMQLMTYTAWRVGIAERHLFEPAQNVLGGVRLLAVLLRHYDGDVISALVAYNARPQRLFAPIPRNGETPMYVWRVLVRAREASIRLDLLRGATVPQRVRGMDQRERQAIVAAALRRPESWSNGFGTTRLQRMRPRVGGQVTPVPSGRGPS